MSKIHLEILDRSRLNVFKKLSIFDEDGYLAGGTALALLINHRISVDFDVFVNGEIDNKFRLKIKKIFGDVEYYVNTSDQVSFQTEENIKITFLWYYFKTLKPLINSSFLRLASIEDIASDKAQTVGRRAVWRDYVDLFCLLKNNYISLEKIIESSVNKFKGEFVTTQFLEQLRYFEDLEVAPIQFIGKGYSSAEIKLFLKRSVDDYLEKVLLNKRAE